MDRFGSMVKFLEVINDMNKRGKADDHLLNSMLTETVNYYNVVLNAPPSSPQAPKEQGGHMVPLTDQNVKVSDTFPEELDQPKKVDKRRKEEKPDEPK